jgi:F0F1-type ATP synthase assembly protein I
LQFAAGIIFFVILGYMLDRWLRTTPVFTVVGTLFGATMSFINVYLKLKAMSDAEQERRKRGGTW